MQSWQVVLVVLVAVLVGSLLPVLLQLRRTLHQVERRLRTTGRRIDRTLDEARAAAERVNRLIAGLDGGERQLAGLLASAGQLAETIDKVRSTVHVASAVGAAIAPAVVAMVRSLGGESEESIGERDDAPNTKANGRERHEAHSPRKDEHHA